MGRRVMGFIKGLIKWLLVLIALAVGVAFVLPKSAHVERTITINRPASEVFGVLDNMHRFNAWSPWFDIDPNAKYTFTGPALGVGSKLAWAGNAEVGSGSMEILEAKPNEGFKI